MEGIENFIIDKRRRGIINFWRPVRVLRTIWGNWWAWASVRWARLAVGEQGVDILGHG